MTKYNNPAKQDKPLSLLEAALAYSARGWRVIPTIGKKAAGRWKQYQMQAPSKQELREMFRRPGIDGLAVVLGSASGGLACRDFDSIDAYKSWKVAYPDLASTLPTVRTYRGRHVYFIGPSLFRDLGDGEYRGDSGHYCLLPPSRHPDGIVYRWAIPLPDGNLSKINPHKTGLLCATQRTQRTHEVSELTVSSTFSVSSVSSVLHEFSVLQSLSDEERDKAIQTIANGISATLPDYVGQRHRKLFDLSRILKSIPALADVKAGVLRPIIEEWHRHALPNIGTKDFLESWGDFIAAWRKAKYAVGEGPVEEAFERAKGKKPPRKAVELYKDAPITLLAAFCRELQRKAGEEPFFLDCRTAGRLFDVHYSVSWRWLSILCEDGILKLEESGSQATHKANSYRYTNP